MKFFLLCLIVICFSSGGHSRPAEGDSKMPNIYTHFIEPVSNLFQTLTPNSECEADSYKKTSGKREQRESQSRRRLNTRSRNNISVENDTMEWDMENTSLFSNNERNLQSVEDERNLALSCLSSSIPVTATVNVYYCNNSEVTKAAYEAAGGDECNITQTTKDLCYCSYEYFGDRCETFNIWTCEIEQASHPNNCTGVDSFNYVYSYTGMAPCHYVQDGETIVLKNRAVCKTNDISYNFEGIKHSKYEVITQPNVGPNPFTYVINNDRVKLLNDPFQVRFYLRFVNWKYMTSNANSYDIALTRAQIAGEADIENSITFNPTVVSLASGGRYYYEMRLRWYRNPSSNYYVNYKYAAGYLEQAGYQEPPPAPKGSKVLVIVLPIAGALILVMFIVGYKMYQNRKEMRKNKVMEEKGEIAPLIADE